MAKNPNAPKLPPASAPGAGAPDPEPEVTTPAGSEGPQVSPEATEPQPPEATEPQPPEATEPPQPTEGPQAPGASALVRCRVNWRFAGFREEELNEGDEVEATETEVAPFLGGVLSLLEPQA
jgi:hypothetical protein